MSVSAYFKGYTGTIPNGASFRVCPEFNGCIKVVDEDVKTVAIVSIANMLMIEIDAEKGDKEPDDATASPSAD